MKRIICLSIAGLFLFCSLGCNTTNNTGEGAVIGGLLGATAGGIIGHNDDRHGGEGAAIGAAAGALTGALIGSQVKKQPAQPAGQSNTGAQSSQAVNPNQISLQQVAGLAKQGVHEDVIIDKIRLSNSRYNLNTADIDYLKKEGVSQKVIDAMQAQK
jgi:uncharacterized protein YcfJ